MKAKHFFIRFIASLALFIAFGVCGATTIGIINSMSNAAEQQYSFWLAFTIFIKIGFFIFGLMGTIFCFVMTFGVWGYPIYDDE